MKVKCQVCCAKRSFIDQSIIGRINESWIVFRFSLNLVVKIPIKDVLPIHPLVIFPWPINLPVTLFMNPFVPAGEIIGAKHRIRTITITDDPALPDGSYSFIDHYCTDKTCDCRKAIIQVYHQNEHVSTVTFGWENKKFYTDWMGTAKMKKAKRASPSNVANKASSFSPSVIKAFYTSGSQAHLSKLKEINIYAPNNLFHFSLLYPIYSHRNW